MPPRLARSSRRLGGRLVLALALAGCGGSAPVVRPGAAPGPCPGLVCVEAGEGHLALIRAGQPAALYADAGVLRAVRDLQTDLGGGAGASVALDLEALPSGDPAVIVGTLGRSGLVDRLVAEGEVDTTGVSGQWEAFVQQTVEDPLPGVERALVIAGSDRRGTVFGVYDLVEEMGVSPWHYWADVPVEQRANLYVRSSTATGLPPHVERL